MVRLFSGAAIVALGVAMSGAPAASQENVMKACGDKWQAAKTAGSTGGKTWPEYLAACRADIAGAKPAAAPVTTAKPGAAAAPTASGSTKPAVFPDGIASKFADEKPARARQKTCGAQFKANKATDSNGGLKWIEKGGGYWSQCNTRLKATRA
jgi:hypothetical protein